MVRNTEYLQAKLEEIHEDVRILQKHVDELRQEAAGRKAVNRFVLTSLGVIGAVVGWLTNHVLYLIKGVHI